MLPIKRGLIIAVLATFCLTSTIFITERAISPTGQYDPWKDVNDDGSINIVDIAMVAKLFGTTGTPVNKTQLMALAGLEARVAALEARADALENMFPVTASNLAPGAIPMNYELKSNEIQLENHGETDMHGFMFDDLSMHLDRPSYVIMIVTSEFYLYSLGWYPGIPTHPEINYIGVIGHLYMQDGNDYGPYPGPIHVISDRSSEENVGWDTQTVVYVAPDPIAGDIRVNVEWWVGPYAKGSVRVRTLLVYALPA